MSSARLLCFTLALLALGLLQAQANHRADFFDTSRRPSVRFDKKRMEWTLRNQALERVIQYDAQKGALRTVSLRDASGKLSILSAPEGEGEIAFVAPLMEAPQPLTQWRVTTTPPASDWNTAKFNDSAWQAVTLPYQPKTNATTHWLRCALPANRMVAGRGYALWFDRALSGDAEISIDGEVVRQVKASEPQRQIQIDLRSNNRVVAIKLSSSHSHLGVVGFAEAGSAPPNLDLQSDWKYILHSLNTGPDGSQTLTISLSGLQKYEGFDLDVSYQIYPGNEPFIVKNFTFLSHRQSRFLIEQATVDRWLLPAESSPLSLRGYDCLPLGFPASRMGLMTATLTPLGRTELSEDNKSVAPILRPYLLVKPNVPVHLPKTLTSVYPGTAATGFFLYQLYIGQYIAPATPDSLPISFDTGPGYGRPLTAALCEQLIPPAIEIGAKMFILGDGWQSNLMPESGFYGDWETDRGRFPQGLMPLSVRLRERELRFGLWTAPIRVSNVSEVAKRFGDLKIKGIGGKPVALPGESEAMCFSTGWEEMFSQSMVALNRILSFSQLQLDDSLLVEGCTEPAHDHPVGHSRAAQWSHLEEFCTKLRKAEPSLILETKRWIGPTATAFFDTLCVSDQDPDVLRALLTVYSQTQPGFTLSATAPCHLPQTDLNALEYALVSAAAFAGNVGIIGELDKSTAAERELIRTWTRWNAENRPWLAYIQPLDDRWAGVPITVPPAFDVILHLRNALQGRYGYLCFWNRGKTVTQATASFAPADYLVRLNPSEIEIIRHKDRRPAAFTAKDGTLTLSPFEMAPRSWEIFEIRLKK